MSSISDILKYHRSKPPRVLESLLAIQDTLGHVPPEAIPEIANVLEVSAAEVAGVLSYYPDLNMRPCGRHRVRVCLGESCVANHSDRVLAAFEECLGVRMGETTPDGCFTLERVYCVGNCAVGPSVMVDDDMHGRIIPRIVPAFLDTLRFTPNPSRQR